MNALRPLGPTNMIRYPDMRAAEATFEAYPPAHRHLDVIGSVGEAVAQLRRATQDADWSAVRARSWQSLGLGTGALRALGIDDGHAAALDARRAATRTSMIGRMQSAAQTAAGRSRLIAARSALEAQRPEVAAALHDLFERLIGGDESALAAAARQLRVRPRTVAHDLAIAARVRGVQGLLHAEFNTALALEKPRTDATALLGASVASVNELEKVLRAHQRRLYHSFGADHRDDAAQAANAIVDALEQRLPSFGVALARMHAAASALRAAKKGGAAERLGGVAVRGSALVRESIATLAACLRIAVEHNLTWSEELDQLFDGTATLAFDAALPDGKNVELAHLASVSDGAMVDVAGFVTHVEAVHPGEKKLVGRVELLDPSSGGTGWIAGVYIDPLHVGIAPGAYVRATGTYRTNSKLRDGEPTVDIEALSLTPLAAKGWRIALLGLAHPWYSPWPNRLALAWSLGPHVPADGAEGAGELVYPPIVRKEP